jgi:hypothetical protein
MLGTRAEIADDRYRGRILFRTDCKIFSFSGSGPFLNCFCSSLSVTIYAEWSDAFGAPLFKSAQRCLSETLETITDRGVGGDWVIGRSSI